MPRKRILVKSIDTSISYQVIGIDLAKHLVSACLITGAGEIFGIDRLTYDDLLKSAERMSPTLFCMEPCPEVHYLAEKLQGYGHHTKVIDGAAVKEYIKTHFGGQKTDLNDAQAIAFLSLDTNLPEITPKNTSNLISLKYANGLRNGANSDTHRCKQLTEHGEERCIKLREVAGFSAVRTIFQIVGPRKILHCLLGK